MPPTRRSARSYQEQVGCARVDSPGGAAPLPEGWRALAANRNFRWVFSAGVISTAGSTFSNLAILWIVFASTGSALDVAYVGVANLAGQILVTLPAGVWVDRYSRRRLMILSDLARAGCSGLLALVLVLLGFSLLAVLTVSFAWAAAGAVFNPAEQSLLPALVSPSQIPSANGWIQSSRSISSLVAGPAAGLLILVVGAVPSLWVNAATFVASAALLSLVVLPVVALPQGPPAERALFREMGDGMRWLYSQKGLFLLSVSAGPLNFFSTIFQGFTVVFVVVVLHGNAFTLGVLTGLSVLGAALGALLVGWTGAIHRAGQVWLLSYGGAMGAMIVAIALFPRLVVAAPLFFATGLVGNYAGATWLSTAQILVPSSMQGRYFSVDGLLSWGILPLGQIAGGILITEAGVGTAFLIAGLGMMAVALAFLPARALWRWGVPRPAVAGPG